MKTNWSPGDPMDKRFQHLSINGRSTTGATIGRDLILTSTCRWRLTILEKTVKKPRPGNENPPTTDMLGYAIPPRLERLSDAGRQATEWTKGIETLATWGIASVFPVSSRTCYSDLWFGFTLVCVVPYGCTSRQRYLEKAPRGGCGLKRTESNWCPLMRFYRTNGIQRNNPLKKTFFKAVKTKSKL
jgi:hypothetical protein